MRDLLTQIICFFKGHQPAAAYMPWKNGARRIVICYRCRRPL